MQGLIIENISNLYKIKSEDAFYNATARGKFKQEGVTPLVGDIVDFNLLEDKESFLTLYTAKISSIPYALSIFFNICHQHAVSCPSLNSGI